ncbi:MAG: hypothetical protein ACRDHX_04285 [Chloroflexota bacterium]
MQAVERALAERMLEKFAAVQAAQELGRQVAALSGTLHGWTEHLQHVDCLTEILVNR